jgi:serine/threonine protein kinase
VHAYITLTNGKQKDRRYVIRPGQTFHIGRTSEASIRLDETSVSRRHAQLEMRADGLYVIDLGSSNGTFVGGRQLSNGGECFLPNGQHLELGSQGMVVELVGFDTQARERVLVQRQRDQPRMPSDDFELLALVGQGSYSRVWAAWQQSLDRVVAIKVLDSSTGGDESGDARQRFVSEARLWCQLKSPYIVRFHDFRFTPDGTPCIIMELVQGPTVADLLADGPLPLAQVLAIGGDVSRALQEISTHGIVHRDIKPANVMVSPEGVAKLADFGIAKELGTELNLTDTGVGVGTLSYVSPEQVEGGADLTIQADVYSLGAMLYQLIGGRTPFARKTSLSETLDTILKETPKSLTALRHDCPARLDLFVCSMLAKLPAERPTPQRVVEEMLNLRALLAKSNSGRLSSTTTDSMVSPRSDPRDWLPQVMIVSGEEDERVRLKAALESRFRVYVTSQVVDLLRHGGCDLVVLDQLLAQGDGDTLARSMRRLKSPPRLVMLGDASDGLAEAALAVGADGHLARDLSAAELCELVAGYVTRPGGPPAEPPAGEPA